MTVSSSYLAAASHTCFIGVRKQQHRVYFLRMYCAKAQTLNMPLFHELDSVLESSIKMLMTFQITHGKIHPYNKCHVVLM